MKVLRHWNGGSVLVPHRYGDGMFEAGAPESEYERVRVATVEQLIPLMEIGYGVRMSDPAGPVDPVLIAPGRIQIVQSGGARSARGGTPRAGTVAGR